MSSFQNGIQHLPHLKAAKLQVSEFSICLNRRIALCKFSQTFWVRLDSLLPLSGCCHGQALVGTSAKVRPPLERGGISLHSCPIQWCHLLWLFLVHTARDAKHSLAMLSFFPFNFYWLQVILAQTEALSYVLLIAEPYAGTCQQKLTLF